MLQFGHPATYPHFGHCIDDAYPRRFKNKIVCSFRSNRNEIASRNRCEKTGGAAESPIGWLPSPHDVDLEELDVEHKCIVEILGVDHEEWQKELDAHKKFFESLGGVVPEVLLKQREQLAKRFAEITK